MQLPVERKFQKKSDEVIVVKLWEVYLRYQSHDLFQQLVACSIDKGPFNKLSNPGRLTFRFGKDVWNNQVRSLLYEHRVPVMVQSNPLYAVQTKIEAKAAV